MKKMNNGLIDINILFPVILYILGIILLIVLIILVLKLIKTVGKINNVVDDVQEKSNKLNGVFSMVDNAADMINTFSDKIVAGTVGFISSIFDKRKKDNEDE